VFELNSSFSSLFERAYKDYNLEQISIYLSIWEIFLPWRT